MSLLKNKIIMVTKIIYSVILLLVFSFYTIIFSQNIDSIRYVYDNNSSSHPHSEQKFNIFAKGLIYGLAGAMIAGGSAALYTDKSRPLLEQTYPLLAFESGWCIGTTYGTYSMGKSYQRKGKLSWTFTGSAIGCAATVPLVYLLNKHNKKSKNSSQKLYKINSYEDDDDGNYFPILLGFIGFILPATGATAGYMISDNIEQKKVSYDELNNKRFINFSVSPMLGVKYVGMSLHFSY